MMKVEVEQQGGCRRSVSVAVAPDQVREDYDRIVKLYAQHARVSGFRQGRAPRELVEKRFAKRIVEDAKEQLLPRFYREALQQENLEPVALIDLSEAVFSRTDGFSFRVVLDVAPEFKLPKYRKLVLKSEPVAVTEEHVDGAIDATRERFARFEYVADRGVATGDLVQVDYRGTVDGTGIAELADNEQDIGKGEDFWVPIDTPEFLPGFNAGLEGAAIGEHRQVTIAFPDDYRVAVLGGKTALYEVDVKAIRGRTLPALDEEFLKRLEVASVEDLRREVREQLTRHAEQAERMRLRDEAARQLLDKADFEVPESLLQREQQSIVRELIQAMAQRGESREQMQAQRDALMSTATERARERLRISYILSAIGREEKIEISDSDVETRLEAMAGRYGMPLDRFKAELEKREGGLDAIRHELQSERTMEFIVEHAKIKD